jgi:uncharacterized membrane protein HdeD (DUF308 family)
LTLGAHRDGRAISHRRRLGPRPALQRVLALASVLGLLLILRGTFDIITAVVIKDINSAWWLGLVAGILDIFLGFWAAQQFLSVRGALLLSGSGCSPCSAASPRS